MPATSAATQTRDIVVIGGSGGALDALRPILAGVPADLPAALFVDIHIGPVSTRVPKATAAERNCCDADRARTSPALQ